MNLLKCALGLLLSLILISSVHSTSMEPMEVCKQKSPCSCMFPNGTGVDLSPAAKQVYKAIAYLKRMNGEIVNTYSFYFHPCNDVQMDFIVEPDVFNTCTGPAALCRHMNMWNKTVQNTLTKVTEAYDWLGSSNDESIAEDGSYIIYYNRPSQTIVYLVCADIDGHLAIKDISEPNSLELQFFSRYACLRQLPIPGSSQGPQVSDLLWPQPPKINPINWGLFQPNLRIYNIY